MTVAGGDPWFHELSSPHMAIKSFVLHRTLGRMAKELTAPPPVVQIGTVVVSAPFGRRDAAPSVCRSKPTVLITA
jgi:hypothetical protein